MSFWTHIVDCWNLFFLCLTWYMIFVKVLMFSYFKSKLISLANLVWLDVVNSSFCCINEKITLCLTYSLLLELKHLNINHFASMKLNFKTKWNLQSQVLSESCLSYACLKMFVLSSLQKTYFNFWLEISLVPHNNPQCLVTFLAKNTIVKKFG